MTYTESEIATIPKTNLVLSNSYETKLSAYRKHDYYEDSKIGIRQLIETSEEMKEQQRDVAYDCYRLKMVFEGNELRIKIAGRYFTLSDHALNQLCTMIGIPSKYIRKCGDGQKSDLILDNMNTWLKENNKQLFIRLQGKTVRGILSKRYSVLDATEILNTMEPYMGDFEIRNGLLTPERVHLRLTLPDQLNVAGEDLYQGIQIDSSDVGQAPLTVKYLLFKLVCTNGMTINKHGGEIFHQKHVGIDRLQFEQKMRRNLVKIPDVTKEIVANINDAREAQFIIDDLKKALETDPIIRGFKDATLSNTDLESVLEIAKDQYSQTEWGTVNALTDYAKTKDLDRRMDIERIASRFLTRQR